MIIYMDNSATTSINEEALKLMDVYERKNFANASSTYNFAMEPKMAIDKSRKIIAEALGARREEIFFTSGGTESDNWAIKGAAFSLMGKGKHIITSCIEHHAVLHSCAFLEKLGFEVTYLKVDKEGFVDLNMLKKSIRKDTILVSIMMANNECGTIENILEIGKICREHGVVFHTDAVQAITHMEIDVNKLNVDMLSISAHKFGGPKGIGALYIKKGINIENLMHGGAQERNRRPGTYNTAAIAAMGLALKLSMENMNDHIKYTKNLRDMMIKSLLEIEGSFLNGPIDNRLPGNINIGFDKINSETLLMILDEKNICASAGSACSAGAIEPSHVLMALGLSKGQAKSSIRLSLSSKNTEEEVKFVINVIKTAVSSMRNS